MKNVSSLFVFCFFFFLYRLNNNSITAEGCAALTSAFNSNPSNLIELDLSGNKLGDSGIQKICLLLTSTECKLEKLKCVFTLMYISTFDFTVTLYFKVSIIQSNYLVKYLVVVGVLA